MFNPLSLFSGGTPGVWYDPSDFNLYMGSLGPELVTNGDFSGGTTGWAGSGSAALSVVAGQLKVENGATVTAGASQTLATVPGTTYKWTYYADPATSGGAVIRVREAVSLTVISTATRTTAGTYEVIFTATSTSTQIQAINSSNTLGLYQLIDNISVKELTAISTATMFQDATGTTPVTAVEQPVGLMLDKSQGLVLGPELVTNGDFSNGSTGWTTSVTGSNLITISGGSARFQATGADTATLNQLNVFTIGKWYSVEFDILAGSTGQLKVLPMGYASSEVVFSCTPGRKRFIGLVTGQTAFTLARVVGQTADAYIDSITVKELSGNHAYQSTSASRPVLSARYNLLLNSVFANTGGAVPTGYSQSFGTGASAPSGTASNGDTIYTQTAVAERPFFVQGLTTVVGVTYTNSMTVTEASGVTVAQVIGAAGVTSTYTLNGVSVLGSVLASPGVLAATWTSVATNNVPRFGIGITGNATGSISFHGAQLVVTNSLTSNAYQRVNTATDYDTTGFLPYLRFDGVDDSLSTNSISFTSTDKMSVFAGVRKLSDAARGMIAELGNDTTQSFQINAPSSPGASYSFGSRGSGALAPAVFNNVSVAAPTTNTLTGLGDIAGDLATLRINGAQVAQSAVDQGTGNYGNYPLFIGRRNNAAVPFNGQLYSMVIVGKAVTAGELTNTEKFVATKTGVTL